MGGGVLFAVDDVQLHGWLTWEPGKVPCYFLAIGRSSGWCEGVIFGLFNGWDG